MLTFNRDRCLEIARDRFLRSDGWSSVAFADAMAEAGLPDDIPEAEAFAWFSDVLAPQILDETVEAIAAKVEDGKLRIWRAVEIEGDPVETLIYRGHIGIFWSHDPDRAHPHNGDRDGIPTYIFEAEATLEDIDWEATLACHIHADWWGEEEIRLKPAAQVMLKGLVRREGWLGRAPGRDDAVEVPLGPLAGRLFPAGDPAMADLDVASLDETIGNPENAQIFAPKL